MAARLTAGQLRTRAIAYEEAAGHLELAWTDDAAERDEGDRLCRLLTAEAARLRKIAAAREFNDPRLLPSKGRLKP